MPFRIRNCGRIFYGGGAFRSGVQPPTGTILTDAPTPTAPGPPSTILAPHSFTVRPSRTLLIANKRIQSRTLIKQITSSQMLKQPLARKSIGFCRIQNTKCPCLIQIQANLPVPFHLHCSSKRPCTNPHPHSRILLPVSRTPCRLPSPYPPDRHIPLFRRPALGLLRKRKHSHSHPKPPHLPRKPQNQRSEPRQKTAKSRYKHLRLVLGNLLPSRHLADCIDRHFPRHLVLLEPRTKQNQRSHSRHRIARYFRKHRRSAPDNYSPSQHSANRKRKHSSPHPALPAPRSWPRARIFPRRKTAKHHCKHQRSALDNFPPSPHAARRTRTDYSHPAPSTRRKQPTDDKPLLPNRKTAKADRKHQHLASHTVPLLRQKSPSPRKWNN